MLSGLAEKEKHERAQTWFCYSGSRNEAAFSTK